MTLEDFRRISTDPKAASAKLLEKVELLADESLVKRSEAVLAWKSSPLHQLYLNIGRESMWKSINVSEIIQQLQKQGKQTLNKDEFFAISDLNQKLAY